VLVGADVQVLADAVGGSGNSGGTNVLDARNAASDTGQVTIAAGAQVLATAGGSDGSNQVDACVAPSVDPAVLVDPTEVLTLACLAGETPPTLADPATGQPLVCEDFGLVFFP
jgi:hypothetical protein